MLLFVRRAASLPIAAEAASPDDSFASCTVVRRLTASVALVLLSGLMAVPAIAADEIMVEIVTIGTRTAGRTVDESPVPVDLLSSDALEQTGQTEVGRMLQSLAPSFNFSSSTISDGTDALRPATLRGLGPDQTLVLVNGQRRHGSALVHVNTSVGRGTAGTDLNAIPVSAIKRIEILRDGASAQYGSDAIAGVINIVLKDASEGGLVSTSYGQYTEGDGETFVASLNDGLEIGSGGFLNLDIDYRDRGRTNRAGLTGVCQYVNTCVDIGGGVQQTTDPREIIFDRKNFRIGDADSQQFSAVANFGIPLVDGIDLYAFATYSDSDNTSGGFYRRANQPGNNPIFRSDGVTPVNNGNAFYPDGFLPLINTDIQDFSVNGGLRGEFNEWSWDADVGYGRNDFGFFISNSVNASLVSATGTSPTAADAGELSLGLFTVDLGASRPVSWGNVAFGAAYRKDTYEIKPGELVSYGDFDTVNGVSIGPLDAIAGIQVFPGFSPLNQVDEDRDAWSLYVDVEYSQIDRLLLGAAVRFEDYSDFGSTINGKLSASYDLTDTFMVRGAVSTGFRAPSLQQQFFNNTSTQFVGGVAQERGTFRNDSPVAKAIGIPELKEETSVNLAAGFVWRALPSVTVTLDLYNIDISDRIVISGSIGQGLDPTLDAALAAANANSAQFFLNAADTSTTGVDLIVDYSTVLWDGDLQVSLAGNYTDTDIDSVKAPDSLSNVPGIQDLVFTSQDRSIITEWQPEDRINLSVNYGKNDWDMNLAFNRYGDYTVEDGGRQTFGAKTLVDAQFAYNFGEHLRLKVGGNNIFDTVPDTNTVGQTRAGMIVDGNGNTIVDTPGSSTSRVVRLRLDSMAPTGTLEPITASSHNQCRGGIMQKIMKTVRQILGDKPRGVLVIGPDASVFDALRLMAEHDVGALVVLDSDRLTGIFSERDYARQIVLVGKSSRETKVRDIMTQKVMCVSPEQTVEDCMTMMTEKRVRHLPVLDRKKVVGVISIGDVVKVMISEQQQVIEQLEQYIHS
ncbi:MAG: TonB-dependent receptor [Gammaproteobacteria bacterium]